VSATVSAVVVARNEEVVIRRCLERDTTVRRLGSLLRLATALAGHGFRRLWERRGTP